MSATAHASELAKLRELVTPPVSANPFPQPEPNRRGRSTAAGQPAQADLVRYGYELARLVVGLVDRGHLKSTRRYAMAKDLIAAYEGGAR